MNQPTSTTTATPQPGVIVGDVYVLTEHHRDNATILYITTSLDDAQNFHANSPIRGRVHPWERKTTAGATIWVTRRVSGADGAILFISKMPLHALPGATADTITDAIADFRDRLLDDDPSLDLMARGIVSDPDDPTTGADTGLPGVGPAISDAAAGERYNRLRAGLLALIPTTDPELIDAGYAIPAADILALLDPATCAPADPSLATMSDAEAFRDDFYIAVPTISDGDLIALMNEHPHLLSLAREWGWNETQVRDEFAAILEANGHTRD